jgi:hypothetical protein
VKEETSKQISFILNGNREVEQMETSWLKVKLPPDNISEKDHIFTGGKCFCTIITIRKMMMEIISLS